MTARKPVRVRKARRSGTCPICPRWIPAGRLIASVRGGPFGCLDHVTKQDTNQRKDTTMTETTSDTITINAIRSGDTDAQSLATTPLG